MKWISVKERLPEDKIEVLVWVGGTDPWPEVAEYSQEDKRWKNNSNSSLDYNDEFYPITHWAEIEPPEKE